MFQLLELPADVITVGSQIVRLLNSFVCADSHIMCFT